MGGNLGCHLGISWFEFSSAMNSYELACGKPLPPSSPLGIVTHWADTLYTVRKCRRCAVYDCCTSVGPHTYAHGLICTQILREVQKWTSWVQMPLAPVGRVCAQGTHLFSQLIDFVLEKPLHEPQLLFNIHHAFLHCLEQ